MGAIIMKLGGFAAATVAKVGVAAVITNPVTWVVAGTAIAGAIIYDAAQDK